jgi:hypothetical protein
MSNLRCKRVFRLDGIQRHFRLWRIMYERGKPGDGKGYSVKLTVALARAWWAREKLTTYDRMVTVLGLRLHYSRNYGGTFV